MNFLINIVVGLVLSVVGNLAQQAFSKKQEQRTGTRGSSQVGGTTPQSFLVGTIGVPGKLEYTGEYGSSGGVPNAYAVDVISLGDLPITGFTGLYVNGTRVSTPANGEVEQGFPVPEYNLGGGNKLWWRFRDGTQNTADPYLLDRFSGRADRPWSADMVGRGVPLVALTALWHESAWTQAFQSFMVQVQGIKLYDPRRDSTAGGNGPQRWGQENTYEFSDNNIVIVYNIERGIYYQGKKVWGGDATAAQLDYAVWSKAMDECDRQIALAAGGSEKQFRGGREIFLNERPADVEQEFLIGANARIHHGADGSIDVIVGVPDTIDGAFTDADVLATEPLGSIPFPNLDDVVNGAVASYLEPAQAWEFKETAPYYRSDLVAEDDGREQLKELQLGTTFSGTQAQRVIKAVVEESRRFGRHVVALPPAFAQYRPLQVLTWTSERFGYSSKRFLITARTLDVWGNVVFGLQEIDPADHGWNPSTDERPLSFAPVTTNRPAPQPVSGFYVEPVVVVDSLGRNRRGGYAAFWSAPSVAVDVESVRIEHRLFGEEAVRWVGLVPRPNLLEGSAQVLEALLPGQEFEVQIQYLAASGRPTLASGWLRVEIPNIRLTSLDVEIDEIAAEVRESVGELLGPVQDNAREALERIREAFQEDGAASASAYLDRQKIRTEVTSVTGQARADASSALLAATGPDSALALGMLELRSEVFDPVSGLPAVSAATRALEARVDTVDGQLTAQGQLIDFLEVSYRDVSASGLLSVDVRVAPSGVSSRIAFASKATAGGVTANPAMMLDASVIGGVLTSEILLVAGRVSLVATDAQGAPKRGLLVVDGDNVYIDNARIRNLTAAQINVQSIFGVDANFTGTVKVGPGGGAGVYLQGPNSRILVVDNT